MGAVSGWWAVRFPLFGFFFLPLGVQGRTGLLARGQPCAGGHWVTMALSWNSSGSFFFLVLT